MSNEHCRESFPKNKEIRCRQPKGHTGNHSAEAEVVDKHQKEWEKIRWEWSDKGIIYPPPEAGTPALNSHVNEKRIAVLRVDSYFISRFQKDPLNAVVNLLEGIPQGAVLYKAIWDPREMLGLVFTHESFDEVFDGMQMKEIELKPTGKFPWELDAHSSS